MVGRGFLAEIQRQSRAAAADTARQERAAVKEHQAASRRVAQARKAAERQAAQAARALEADRKQAEKAAAEAHLALMQAEVDDLNRGLAETYDEIDSLLTTTLSVDDHVDLESLRRTAEHPAFDRADLDHAIPMPVMIPEPDKPVLEIPPPPGGFFRRKQRHAALLAAAESAYADAYAEWERQKESLQAQRQTAATEHQRAESERVQMLSQERARYQSECDQREAEVAEHNLAVDTLIANLGYGTVEAVQEYVSIVLANSVYPQQFMVEHSCEFEPSTAELRMRVLVPGPSTVPTVKAFKYTKSTDQITSTNLSQKIMRDRYAGAVHQVAIRSLHEIFEADRRGLINAISLELATETIVPATGQMTYIPFVALAVERETFIEFDLTEVVPTATLAHLKAAVSKNPYALTPVSTGGVRKQ